MTRFEISSHVTCRVLGEYEGTDKTIALDAMARDAGYADFREYALVSVGDAYHGDKTNEELVEYVRDGLLVRCIA